jgi:3-oxoacyl-[acyl-carrier protein] reductase
MLVVGGGGVGNGRGIAFGVAAAGARVAVADLDVDRAREVAQKITEQGGEAHPLRCNVLVPEDIERVTAETVNALGGLDSVVTVVGGYSLFARWTPR